MENSHQSTEQTSHDTTQVEVDSQLWPFSVQQKWLFDQQKSGQIGAINQLLLRLPKSMFSGTSAETGTLTQRLKECFESVMNQHDVFTLSLVRSSQFKYPQLKANATHCLVINTRDSSDLQEFKNETDSEISTLNNKSRASEKTLAETLLSNSARYYDVLSKDYSDNRVVVDLWALGRDNYVCLSVSNYLLDQNSLINLWEQVERKTRRVLANDSSVDGEINQEELTQYSQYIAWQQDLAQDDDAQLAKEYWTGLTLDNDGATSLVQPKSEFQPNSEFQPKSKSHEGNSSAIRHISTSLQIDLPDNIDRQAILLAAWQCLYARLRRADNVSVYVSMDLRHDYDELEDSLGCFQNWAPFNTTVAQDSGFNSLQAWADQQWQEHAEWLDFYQLADNSNEPRCYFHYQKNDPTSENTSETVLQSQLQNTAGLLLHCLDDGKNITLQVSIDTSVLPKKWVGQLLACYEQFLKSSLDDLTQPVLQQALLPLASPQSEQALDEEPGSLITPSIIERFSQTVEQSPEQTALVFGSTSLSYQSLDYASSLLAEDLLSVTDSQPVLLCIERSAAMIIGLLACLKAGKPYVPIDQDQPANRLKRIIEHTQATTMLVNNNHSSLDYFTGKLIVIDSEQLIDQASDSFDRLAQNKWLSQRSVPDNRLAYIIYTSGSTGEPKAVAITHRNLEHYVDSISDVLPIKPGLSYATVSTLSADLGNTAIFPALTQGGTLHVIDYASSTNGEAFSQYMRTNHIDVLKIVPSHYQALCAALPDGDSIMPQTAIVFGGELLPAALALECQDQINQHDSTCRVFNHYGPTETTIGAFTLDIKQAQQSGLLLNNHASVPIGFALGEGHFFVADSFGNRVPSGCAGELYIGGPGVSPGYLGNDEIAQSNNQKSFTSPGGISNKTQRYYRTGDLVRELNCAGLEFLGRTDEQVKLRGFRIELNAIRHTVRKHQHISNALVMVIEQQITAFCVTTSGVSESTLKAELQEVANDELAHYMVPSNWVFIRRLPLTDNGKPDRKALLILAQKNAEKTNIEPAVTETEKSLAKIWQALLGRDVIGRNSHFFESGGHSLLATQLVFKAQTELSIDIPLGQIFDTPVLSQLAEFIDQNKQSGAVINMIEKCPDDVKVPLTFAQQRLWFMQQLAPESAAYNVPAVIDLHGDLNVVCLQKAFAAVLERHSGLCVRFEDNQGAVHFSNSNYVLPKIVPIDVNLELENTISNINKHLISKPFDLSNEPAIRVGFSRFTEKHHQLVVVMHHIICDGWSRDVLIQDLTQAYHAYCNEQPLSWSELPISYKDFAYWQSQKLDLSMESHLGYWQNYLAEEQDALKLTAQQRRPEQQQFNGSAHQFNIDDSLVSELRSLSNQHSTTLFTTLLSAFHVLLLRYSGQPLVRVGFPISGRNHGGLENLVGLLTNTLVTQSHNTPVAFDQLLQQQRDDMRQAFEHQDLPFEMLVGHLQPRRSLSHSPIFQAFFSLQPARQTGVSLDNLTLDLQSTDHVSSKFDVSLLIDEPADSRELKASLEYDTALFDQVWIQQFSDHFMQLLRSIVNDATQNIQALSMLTESEQLTQVIGNEQEVNFDFLSSFQSFVENQPSALALAFEQTQRTYADLDNEISLMASGLLEQGIDQNDRVVIRLERSIDLLVSMLGVMRVGACFVPLDPILPTERQNYIVEQCRATLIISSQRKTDSSNILCLTTEQIKNRAGNKKLPKLDEQRPAYILYTSGSTGKPKGVEVGLNALNCLLEAMQEKLSLKQSDAWLAITSISFDISILELLLPLSTGASVVLTNAEQSHTPTQLANLITQHSISVMQATPGAWQQLLESNWQAPHPMTLLSGGEAMTSPLAAKLLPQSSRLLNVYGPTEATIWASCKEVQNADDISLGLCLKNYHSYILNDSLQIQPHGTIGQLAIAGPGLANGYFDQPELTAKQFVNHNELGRLYLTGDLAYKDQRGELNYLGRADDQIKWRGYRIELGEVAESVEKLDAVSMSSCQLLDDQLVCFYTHLKNNEVSDVIGQTEKESLRKWLPSYMMPSQFLALEALPLTTSGKVDRQALKQHWESLKATMLSDNALNSVDTVTFTPTEKNVLALWQALLPNAKLGLNDDFFTVGGHSLLLTRLLDRIRTQFSCELALHTLFEATTIAKQAALIDSDDEKPATVLPILSQNKAPLSFAQQRLWFLDQFISDRSAYNVPLAINLKGELNIKALDCSLQKMLLEHPQLRTQLSSNDAKNQKPSQEVNTACELTLQSITVQDSLDVKNTLERLSKQTIDLYRAPLANAHLLSTKGVNGEHTLLLVVHHIVVDGWSLSILYRDLIRHYTQFSTLSDEELASERCSLIEAQNVEDQSLEVQQKRVQYTDFAAWQHSHDFNERLDKQLDYWKTYLGSNLTPLTLPLDKPRPKQQTFNGAVITEQLSHNLSEQLSSLAAQKQCSPFVLFMALYAKLLSRYSGQNDIFIGTPIANRHIADTSEICGLFANTQVYRCPELQSQTLDGLINQIKGDSITAQKYQDLPFEQLVNALSPERDHSRTPLFQAMMVLQQSDNSLSNVCIDGLEATIIPNNRVSAKFDLTLNINVRSEQQIELSIEYNKDLFEPQTIIDMMATLQAQCHWVTDNSVQQTNSIDTLNGLATEHVKAIETANNTDVNVDLDTTIIELFAQQCAQNPDTNALVFNPPENESQELRSLTFKQLDQLTSLVAAQIIAKDTRANPIVGIVFDRSLSMVVALLGVLKAGAAYLPISPSLPKARQAFMIDNADCNVVIYQNCHSELELRPSKQCLSFDDRDLTEMLEVAQASNLIINQATNDARAYVIYTSGSTGEPKGVAVSHKSLINRLHWQQSLLEISGQDVVLQKTPYAFDVSVWEFLWPIMTGATLSIAAPEAHADPAKLITSIQQNNVTVMHFVPSMLQVFCDHIKANDEGHNNFSSLKTIICSGEALLVPLAKQALSLLPHIDLYNLYGPTEAAIDVSVWHVNQVLEKKWQGTNIPIGSPIANTQLYVLDQNQQQVPVGVSGELYITGVGLADGYVGQAELTQERFSDINIDGRTMRAYRTGDVARWCWEQQVNSTQKSVTIEYLGRTDGQIKLRGQRLELSEIEAVMLQSADIEQAYVVAYPSQQPETLIACVVSSQDTLNLELIKQHLETTLPSYMIPSQVFTIDSVPLSHNGKADRKQLYQYVEEQRKNISAPIASNYEHSALSRQICNTLANLLTIESVSPEQDLFSLGAHSLWMVNLQQQLHLNFGVQLSLNTLFSNSKISDLITLIEKEGGSPKQTFSSNEISQTSLTAMPFSMPLSDYSGSAENPPTLYCIHPASGFSGPFQSIANAMSSHCHVVGVNAEQAIASGQYSGNIDSIAEQYVEQLHKQHSNGDYYFLGWSLGGHIATAMARILEKRGENIGWLGIIDSLLIPKPISNVDSSENTAQRISFYVNSLALLGMHELNTEQLDQLTLIVESNPSNHNEQVCQWVSQQDLFANSLAMPYLSVMLDLIDQGKSLVQEGASNQDKINTITNFYWASETLATLKNPDSMINESHNISFKSTHSKRYKTNHQAIVNDQNMINDVSNDFINAVSKG